MCCAYLWVSGHEAVEVVVDLLEHKASVHQVETALERRIEKSNYVTIYSKSELICASTGTLL